MKHLLSVEQLSPSQIDQILKTADSFREVGTRKIKKVPTLRGRTVCNLFFEPSTRTRISFELAAKRLSADVVNFVGDARSSLSKGESFKDTAQTLQAMGVDAIVVRHSSAGAPLRLSRWVEASVINGGDGAHEHPTQALLDLYSIREHFPSFKGLRVGIVGDVGHSRVARSNVIGLKTMGAHAILVGPPTLMPPAVESWGVEVANDLEVVLPTLDVVYLLRMQRERQNEQLVPSLREYAAFWGLDLRRTGLLKPEAVIMHPGPMNRGIEIAAEVADLERSIITDQVTNGVAVRMSLLYHMLGAEERRPGQARRDSAQLALGSDVADDAPSFAGHPGAVAVG
ncbi:MAG TPA: aspartate carbamoyltransferase catalytic subunit [Actinomycetota bacterium]|nr:aspartate carbamoyltransferase catalytic subunit [Actinomycetota bacterium]